MPHNDPHIAKMHNEMARSIRRLSGIRDDNARRMDEQRSRIWELEALLERVSCASQLTPLPLATVTDIKNALENKNASTND